MVDVVSSYASSSKPNTKASERSSQTGTVPRFFRCTAAFSKQPSPEKGFVQVCFLLSPTVTHCRAPVIKFYLKPFQMDRVLYSLRYNTDNADLRDQRVSSQSMFLEQKSLKRTKDMIL